MASDLDSLLYEIAEAAVNRGYSANTRINMMCAFWDENYGKSWSEKFQALKKLLSALSGPVNSLIDPILHIYDA